jgi:competence protein ComEC
MWLPFGFIRFFLFFALGILTAVYFPSFEPNAFYIFLGITFLGLATWLAIRAEVRRSVANIFGIGSLLCLFLFGFSYTQLQTEKNQPNHFSRFQPLAFYEVVIYSELQATKSGYKAEGHITKLSTDTSASKWQTASGKLMLYFANADSIRTKLTYGKHLIVKGIPTEILPPMNPEEFDYRNYMANLQIHYYHFISNKDFVIIGESSLNPFVKYSTEARNYCDKILRKYIPNEDAYGLATALVLGIKSSLTDEIKNSYSNSGIMHILAVSGMHITLLFNMMMVFLKPLKNNRKTKLYVLAFALVILWFYAFITGLSASVLRAVVMFTFVLGADFFARKIKIYNILAVSAFTMCLLDPYILFDVGFQLSYLAVLGIVFFHPLLYQWITIPFPSKRKKEHTFMYWCRKSPSWVLDNMWQIVCVSIAAQISTSPIALLYFHQFPNYFLLANLFAIPISTLIMYGEILLLLLSFWNFAATYIGWATEKLILFLNFGVEIIEKAPFSITSGIHIFAWETWLLYLVIVLLVLLFYFRKLWYFTSAFVLLCVWCIFQFWEYFAQQQQQNWIIYQTPKANCVEINVGNSSIFIADSLLATDKNKVKFHTANYQFKRSVTDIFPISIEQNAWKYTENSFVKNLMANSLETENFRLFVFRGQKILWLKTKMPISAIPLADFWLITDNNFPKFPKIMLQDSTTILPIHKPKKIIINGSNKYYQLQQFKKIAKQYNLPCHFTQESGAFEIK